MGLLDNAQQGTPMVPDMAEAAAGAGAPAPGAGAQPPGAAPPGGPMPGTGQPPGAAPPGGPAQQGVRQVDPGAAAIEGKLPGNMQEERASPEEQKEYERAMQALSKLLYSNDEIANAIVDQVLPEDKVSSTAKVSILVINQLDQKISMDVSVVASISQETVERISELAEARHGIQYGDRELQVIMGAVWEGVQEMFGMEQQDAEALMAGVGGDGLADLKGQYEGFLNG